MIAQSFLKTLPTTAGVYRMYDAEHHVLYVGKAKNLQRRVRSYFSSPTKLSPRIHMMVQQVHHIEVTLTPTEEEALILEHNLIQALVPKYNIIFRDDKSYPYLTVSTGEVFPKLGYYRSNKSLQLLKSKKMTLFGPFPHAQAVYDTIQILQRIFQLRTCEESVFAHRSRACLLHNIDRCSAPCVKKITPEAYQEDVATVLRFLEGKKTQIVTQLEKKMYEASAAMAFEQAARYRDQLQALQQIQQKQYINSQKPIYLDMIAIATNTDRLVYCFNVVAIRDGKYIGEQRFFYENTYHFDTQVILESFLRQYYDGIEQHALPQQVLLNSKTMPEVMALIPIFDKWNLRFVKKITVEYQAWLKMAEENAQFALIRHLEKQPKQYDAAILRLNQLLASPYPISHIECFDVSHLQGNQTVGSCVVFRKKNMDTNRYRHYQLETDSGNDLIGMHLLLQKHYTKQLKKKAGLPDLILIDGGALQLEVAQQVLTALNLFNQPLTLMSIAKGEGRKAGLETLFIFNAKEQTIVSQRLAADDPVLHLLQHIRDEAHRFAIQYHRLKHRAVQLDSILDHIPQVGKNRKKYLLTQFKTIEKIKQASPEEIAAVPTISSRLAQQIYTFFQEFNDSTANHAFENAHQSPQDEASSVE